jgi:antagonist of KipI
MGLRLESDVPLGVENRPMITEGVALGAIQVPPHGQPIILFVEQQTTGGYPKIANVIAADLHRVGQLRPRDEVRFKRVTFQEARALLIDQEALLRSAEMIVE